MLHSRLMRYIDEVARQGSMRAAADRLHVASSAVNKQILMFEDTLGEPLFERLPRGVRLTPAGEVIVAHIRRTMREYREVEAEIRDIQGLQSGEVVIATMNGLAAGIVPQVASAFCARHPRVKVGIRVMFIPDIVEAVTEGDADLGFAFNLPQDARLTFMDNRDAPLGAVVAANHPLVQMPNLQLAHCAAYPLIFADRAMLIHERVSGAFAAAGLDVAPTFLTNSIESMKYLAGSGQAIAFLTRQDVAEEMRAGTLRYLPIKDRSLGTNRLSLVHRARREPGLASILLAEEIRAALDA